MVVHGIRQRVGAASLIGPRDSNQDAYALEDSFLDGSGALAILAVADGMGGMEGGELASRTALDRALAVLNQEHAAPDALPRAFAAAHEGIRRVAEEHNFSGTGTTLTMALVFSGEAVIAHVGDTRAYLLNGPSFTQITDDHSRVGRLVQEGVLTEEQAMGHPEQNVLERALGPGSLPEVDLYRVGVGPDDILLLSTDGLHGVLTRDELERGLRSSSSLQDACDLLASLAEERGSQDNITAVAWEYPGIDERVERPATQTRAASAPVETAGERQPAPRLWQDKDLVVLAGLLLLGFLLGTGIGFAVGLR